MILYLAVVLLEVAHRSHRAIAWVLAAVAAWLLRPVFAAVAAAEDSMMDAYEELEQAAAVATTPQQTIAAAFAWDRAVHPALLGLDGPLLDRALTLSMDLDAVGRFERSVARSIADPARSVLTVPVS